MWFKLVTKRTESYANQIPENANSDAPATLNVIIRSIGIVILSGFGGNKRYVVAIITAYNSTAKTIPLLVF